MRILSKEFLTSSLRTEKAKVNTEISLSNWWKQLLPHLECQKVGFGEARECVRMVSWGDLPRDQVGRAA